MSVQQNRFYDMPSEQDAKLAATSARILAACIGKGSQAQLRLIDDDQEITVPIKAIHMLADILNQMALGNAISIIPIHAELTTQQAADFLNVSRPYLISHILDAGKLPFHMAGNRRKIYFKDLMEHKVRQKAESNVAMAKLAQLSQDMGLME
jgi:excisionase family DNA binding protein